MHPTTADQTGAVQLINSNVECTSCHNPHVQNVDPRNPNFLVLNNAHGALCTACHSTVPTGSGMGLTSPQVASQTVVRAAGTPLAASPGASKPNPLAGWSTSIHATASNRVPNQILLETNSMT
jgi:predicted CXXCH cytochrome family protein